MDFKLVREIVNILRSNPDKWYGLGNLTARYEWETKNDYYIIAMKIHRILCGLVKKDIIERRHIAKYEYKWKIK